jgi:hypothetical protein
VTDACMLKPDHAQARLRRLAGRHHDRAARACPAAMDQVRPADSDRTSAPSCPGPRNSASRKRRLSQQRLGSTGRLQRGQSKGSGADETIPPFDVRPARNPFRLNRDFAPSICSAASNSGEPNSARRRMRGPLPMRKYQTVRPWRDVSRCTWSGRRRGIATIKGQFPSPVQAWSRRLWTTRFG